MGLTSSLYTALSGLSTNGQALSVAGNNIANSNTVGFKSSRITFETSILQTISSASSPTSNSGGTNPSQVGYGARVGSITRTFTTGSLQSTGVNTDMAINGDGFFVVQDAGRQVYTRAGNFNLDRDYNLVTSTGGFVQGFGIDDDFNVVEGVPENINIPLGILTLAEATSSVRLAGNLNASGDLATAGNISESNPLYTDNTATTAATAADTLASLFNADGDALFLTGDLIQLDGIEKGGSSLTQATFEVGPANTTDSDGNGETLQDLMTFIEEHVGIHTAIGGGITMNGLGQLVAESNVGTVNALNLDGAIVVDRAGSRSTPFTFDETQSAVGESVRTTFPAYDSLGNTLSVNVAFALDEKNDAGTTWRFFVESADDSDLQSALTTGTMTFDNNGRLIDPLSDNFTIDRAGTGAETPQTISIQFTNPEGTISALADTVSQVQTLSQDGSPIGTLNDFNVNGDGTIVGNFSNGLLRPLGRVGVANFSNPIGLVELGGSMFSESVNSGAAQIVTPGSAGTGLISGSQLELSNVELAEEFINLINASTGFSANSRVLTTSDELLQELLNSV